MRPAVSGMYVWAKKAITGRLPVSKIALTTLEPEILIRIEQRIVHFVRIPEIFVWFPVKCTVWVI